MKILNWFKKTYRQYKDSYKHYNLSEYSIQELKNNGFDVKIKHWRFSQYGYLLAKAEKHQSKVFRYLTDKSACPAHLFYSKGGCTKIEIVTPTMERYEGTSYCSISDSFDRKFGIKLALSKLTKTFDTEVKDLITECCGQNCCH